MVHLNIIVTNYDGLLEPGKLLEKNLFPLFQGFLLWVVGTKKEIYKKALDIQNEKLFDFTVDKDSFVNEIADGLDTAVHGDIDARRLVATRIYDNYTQKSSPDWREQGDTNLKGIFDGDEAKPIDDMPQDRVPSLTFKDGATFNSLSRKFSDVDSRVLLMNYFNNTTRELSLIQFFGADYKNGVSRFIKELENNQKYDNAFRSKGRLGEVDAVKRYLDRKINPIIGKTVAHWFYFFIFLLW